MKRNNYRLVFLAPHSPSPSLVASTDYNAKRSAAKLCREINWANSAGWLERKTPSGNINIANFQCAADLESNA